MSVCCVLEHTAVAVCWTVLPPQHTAMAACSQYQLGAVCTLGNDMRGKVQRVHHVPGEGKYCTQQAAAGLGSNHSFNCMVHNVGKRAGDEVIMVFQRPMANARAKVVSLGQDPSTPSTTNQMSNAFGASSFFTLGA